VAEDEFVHHFDGRRTVLENGRGRLQGLEKVRELNRHHRFRLRQRDERDGGFGHDRERSLDPTMSLARLKGTACP